MVPFWLFWRCRRAADREKGVPDHVLVPEMEDDRSFLRNWLGSVVAFLKNEPLAKSTLAVNRNPGRALGSWLWVHPTRKSVLF